MVAITGRPVLSTLDTTTLWNRRGLNSGFFLPKANPNGDSPIGSTPIMGYSLIILIVPVEAISCPATIDI